MQRALFIQKEIQNYYWNEDINCATTMMKILSNIYHIHLSQQTIDAAIGLHGAGAFGAQCGLVEGGLIFIGVLGKQRGLDKNTIVTLCYDYAYHFEKTFGSLSCKILRPQGFHPDNPPHLCETLTNKAVAFALTYCEEKGLRIEER